MIAPIRNSQSISELKSCPVSISVIHIHVQLKFLLFVGFFYDGQSDGFKFE